MRIVITGASGNVGTALLRRLAADTAEHQIVGICRRPPDSVPPYDRVTWVALDLANSAVEDNLAPVLDSADAVVHLAWGFQPSHDTDYLERLAVEGTRAVLAAADRAGVGHFVHMSSVGAYAPGRGEQRVDESWPTEGITSLAYSRHKVAAERLLDASDDAALGGMLIARIRPAFVLQRDAGSALLRYGVPGFIPAAAVRLLPVFPVDRRLVVQGVHPSDVADAVLRVLERRSTGAFNLAAEPPLTRDDFAQVLRAVPVHVPAAILRALSAWTWHARLQPLDPGWIDLAFAVPLMNTGRARAELAWVPRIDARTALAEAVAGMAEAVGTASPALRPRSITDQFLRLLRRGPVGSRKLP
ncbi:MAG: NAD-dependent epimerase/dehydratase family protein [Geodermatophilaceae bacterium]|nr:NAD-dependent epimerase/dehydratase family protein [Geodermatophilaceae bacterium]